MDGCNINISNEFRKSSGYEFWTNGLDLPYAGRRLNCQCGDAGDSVAAMRSDGLNIGRYSCSGRRVETRNG